MYDRYRQMLGQACAFTMLLGALSPAIAAEINSDACLPMSMPSSDKLFDSHKKVFAHYFYPFPLSIDGAPPSNDYYNRNFLQKSGEGGKHAAQGGYLRQRPLAAATNSQKDWKRVNVETEIRMAIARGITGFTVDVMSAKEASNPDSHLHVLLKAAQTVDPRFKIVAMPDIGSDAAAATQIIAAVASSPAAYRLEDGRLVVTAFNAGKNSAQWWKTIFDQLKSQGVDVAFVPTFLGWTAKADEFAPIAYGFSDWGTATAAASESMKSDADAAHRKSKIYMMPVDPQQYRPKDSIFWEAGNSATYRNSWMSAIDGRADWVQVVTWSDFSESSQIEPYTDGTLRTDIGTGFYDLTGYYSTWFLTGQQPNITHDVLYFFYRREPSNAASPAQSAANSVRNSSAEDDIELVAFLTAPGTLEIDIGGKHFTKDAPAGFSSFKVPTMAGVPKFSLSRQGIQSFGFDGPVEIYGVQGLPSGVIDMTYWSGSASQNGMCKF